MRREYYFDQIETFLDKTPQQILGELFENSLDGGSIESTQRDAWMEQINILQRDLPPYRDRGAVFFEYAIPRLGKRIDVVAIIDGVIFVLEFKVGEREFTASAIDQVWDYALDLKNFHNDIKGSLPFMSLAGRPQYAQSGPHGNKGDRTGDGVRFLEPPP